MTKIRYPELGAKCPQCGGDFGCYVRKFGQSVHFCSLECANAADLERIDPQPLKAGDRVRVKHDIFGARGSNVGTLKKGSIGIIKHTPFAGTRCVEFDGPPIFGAFLRCADLERAHDD